MKIVAEQLTVGRENCFRSERRLRRILVRVVFFITTNLGHSADKILLIGGSNHQNFIGRMAQVRGYEENNPHENSPESSFRPETVFSSDGQLLSYYFHPSTTVADLSNGYRGTLHDGWPR